MRSLVFSAVVILAIGLTVRASPERQARGAAAAAAALEKALGLGMKVLDNIMDSHFEDAAKMCIWNDWEYRDQWARIQRTFRYGRMSRTKKTLGIPNGRWFCAYTQAALTRLGKPLDPK